MEDGHVRKIVDAIWSLRDEIEKLRIALEAVTGKDDLGKPALRTFETNRRDD